jgi:hypothetical protein
MGVPMAESSLHRFAVAEIDREKSPVEVYTVVEGEDWEKAAQLAFSAARQRVHADKHIATGVFELKDGYTQRIATAGYARLVTRMAVGSAGFEESLALAGAL